jgi:hypothetical protein
MTDLSITLHAHRTHTTHRTTLTPHTTHRTTLQVDMTNFSFSDIVIGSGKKSAIGLVSMDSANISHISFRNISINGTRPPYSHHTPYAIYSIHLTPHTIYTMHNVPGAEIATPLFLKLGDRAKGEDGKHKGPTPPPLSPPISHVLSPTPHYRHKFSSRSLSISRFLSPPLLLLTPSPCIHTPHSTLTPTLSPRPTHNIIITLS